MLMAKRMLKILFLSMLTIAVTVNADSYAGKPCGQPSSGQTMHIAMNGQVRCCVELSCSKGTVGQMCNMQDAASTKCIACPDNYFIRISSKSSDMFECSLQKPCLRKRGLTIKVKGTSVSDNVCQCDIEAGYWDPMKKEDPKSCYFVECGKGQELTKEGCKSCRRGWFKKNKGIEKCMPWTDCKTLGLAGGHDGNITYDPGCINETVTSGIQTSPVIITGAVGEDGQKKGGLTVGNIIAIAIVGIGIVLIPVVLILYIIKRPTYEDEKPTISLNEVPQQSNYEALHSISRSPGCGGEHSVVLGEHSVGAVRPYQLLNGGQSQMSNPSSPTYFQCEGHTNGVAGSSAQTYEPRTNDRDSQTYMKHPVDSNLSSPTSNPYEVIEEDAEQGGDTPSENNPTHSITVTKDSNTVIINADTVNVQVGKDNQMVIDS